MKHLSMRIVGLLLGGMMLFPSIPVAMAAESAVTSVTITGPASATQGTASMITATYTGAIASSCTLYITSPTGFAYTPVPMSAGASTASASYTFSVTYPTGNYALEVQCFDSEGIQRTSPTAYVAVSAPADSTAPTFTGSGPTTATAGTAVSVTANYQDAVGVTSCDLYVNSVLQGAMSIGAGTSGTASRSHTFPSVGTAFVEIRCRDAVGNLGVRNHSVTVSAASAVTSLSYTGPASATAGSSATFTGTYAGTPTACTLYLESGARIFPGFAMTISDGSLSYTRTLDSASGFVEGAYTANIRCTDAAGVARTSATANLTVSSAASAVTSATYTGPSTVTIGSMTTFTGSYTGTPTVCWLTPYVGGVIASESFSMTFSGGSASVSFAPLAAQFPAGTYQMQVSCYDAAGLDRSSSLVNVAFVAAAGADALSPVVTSIAPVSAVAGSSYTVTAVYSDAVGVTSCDLYVGGSLIGAMTLGASTGGTASRTYTFPSSGSIATEVRCRDAAGNSGNGVITVSVATASSPAPSSTDTAAPSVGPISPNTATREVTQTYSISFADASYITNCTLYVQQGSRYAPYVMSRTGASVGYASYQYTYYASVAPGTYNMYATCTDEYGNVGTGPTTGITVGTTASVAPVTPPGGSYYRQLVKMRCPSGPLEANHPCKAVYYVSSDGKRHAFPNERAYFTWYADFNNVYELDSLSTFSLGANVTYRPGIRLVKFTTLDRVYAVGRNGLLRWITSETAARALYGTQWNRQIDDISDAFYANYRFGTDINTTADFSPAGEAGAVTSVDTNF